MSVVAKEISIRKHICLMSRQQVCDVSETLVLHELLSAVLLVLRSIWIRMNSMVEE